MPVPPLDVIVDLPGHRRALGVPTLDGLGVDGYGAHADYEHMYYSSLEQRVRLMLGLFETLK